MDSPQKKKKWINSSAALISVAIHLFIFLAAGSWVAFKYVVKRQAQLTVEPQRKMERRKLEMPVKQQPFMEKMSQPKTATARGITANRPSMVNIPDQGEFTKRAPLPTFKGAYTNFVTFDNTIEFLSKYRQQDFGISAIDFMGTKGKAEKVVLVVDSSRAMLYDQIGGAESFQMVKDDLSKVIGTLKSATLFNLIAFDHEKVATYSRKMIPATPANKNAITNWFSNFNTNYNTIGIPSELVNYAPQKSYDVVMSDDDRTGWIRGLQAAAEMQPEIIFLLATEWGNTTTLDGTISYFMNSKKNRAYQLKRAALYLEDEELHEELEEYMEEDFTEHRSVAIRMLELENEARKLEELPPKILNDWDVILSENGTELPLPPFSEDQDMLALSPAETRYTTAEVYESIFEIVMDCYGHKGLPQLNIVILTAEDFKKNSEGGSARMTSYAKFQDLARATQGRFRELKGKPALENYSTESYNDILRELEEEIDEDTEL
jgi:hypothetical protein